MNSSVSNKGVSQTLTDSNLERTKSVQSLDGGGEMDPRSQVTSELRVRLECGLRSVTDAVKCLVRDAGEEAM